MTPFGLFIPETTVQLNQICLEKITQKISLEIYWKKHDKYYIKGH